MCVILIIIFLIGLSGQAAAAEPAYIDLIANRYHYNPVSVVDYYRDPGGKKTIADISRMDFKPLGKNQIDFGYTRDKFWLRFGVVNDSTSQTQWALRTFVRFMRPLEIYVSQDGGPPKRVLYNDQHSNFGTRPENIRHLAIEFSLPKGGRDVFYIRFGAGGTAAVPMEITTPRAMATEQAHTLLEDGIFVAVLATLALFNLFHFIAVKAKAYLFYVLQASFMALYVTHLDGFTFQYLWPNWPAWNSVASPVLGQAIHVGGLLFSIAFLRSREYTPRYYRWLITLLVASILGVVSGFVLPTRITNQVGLIMLFVIGSSLLPHAIYVVRRGHISARYYLLGWTFLLSGVGVFAATMLGILDASAISSIDVMKVAMLLEAISFAFGLADQHRRLQIENAGMQQQLVNNLEHRLQEARERIQLEHERETTMRSLLMRSRQLAATSHDINQPILSLRMAVNALSSKIDDPETVSTLDRTLAHMGEVLNTALTDAHDEMRTATPAVMSISVGQLLKEVAAGLEAEAAAASVAVRAFDSRLVCTTSRLPLKRCLFNLLSNAIAHSRGDVLLGARCKQTDIEFNVIDNGIGISSEAQVRLLSPWEQGEHSRGHGLGLAIVNETCKEYGWSFLIDSRLGKGSRFSIRVPRALAHA